MTFDNPILNQRGVQRDRIRGVSLGSGLRNSFRRKAIKNFMDGFMSTISSH